MNRPLFDQRLSRSIISGKKIDSESQNLDRDKLSVGPEEGFK